MTQDFPELPTPDGAEDDHSHDMPTPSKEEVKVDGKGIVAEESEITIAEAVIKTGADAAQHLLPLRDDFDPVISLRSIVLASAVSGFQAVMNQIYSVSSHFRLVYTRY